MASALALQCSPSFFLGGLFSQLLKLRFTAMVTYSSFVFPQFTSFHSVFQSFHGLMNSINWPASTVWVFIAQLGEHCSANAEATGSNPVEAPKIISFVFPQFTSFHSKQKRLSFLLFKVQRVSFRFTSYYRGLVGAICLGAQHLKSIETRQSLQLEK